MSNFNVTNPKAQRSAISLGGEWRSHDQREANKYKSQIQNLRQRQIKGKTKPKKTESEDGRPKSTPSGKQDPLVVLNQKAVTGIPKSAPPGSKPRCERFYEVDQERVGRKILENHLPLKRATNTSPRGDDEIFRQYNLGAGMTMSKSKSKVAVKIDTGLSLDPPPMPKVVKEESIPDVDPERDAMIAQLQQQVADLSMYLGEERLNHKATKEKAAAILKEKLKDLDRKHQERYKEAQLDHEEQIEVMKEIHEREKEHQKNSSDAALARMKGEMEFLQGAFEAYKKTLVQDMEEKWNKKEQDMKLTFQEEIENALHDQRTEMIEEKNMEKSAMTREFQKQIQNMSKEHKKEIENMMKKFSSASTDVDNLRRALDQLKMVRSELDQTVEKLAMTEETLRDTENELQETKLKVLNYQEHFQDKVAEVDDKYKERIHQLMKENTELRKRYLIKCEELFNEKSITEFKRVERVMSTKEMLQMIVHTKNRTNVNMASINNEKIKIPLDRPLSAPTTKVETKSAFQSAGETDHIENQPVQDDSFLITNSGKRPHTTSVSRRKIKLDMLPMSSLLTVNSTSLQSL